MNELDKKKEKQARWLKETMLDKKQFEELIAQKFIRAREYKEAEIRQKVICGDR